MRWQIQHRSSSHRRKKPTDKRTPLFRESSSVALQTLTDLVALKVVTIVRRLVRAGAFCCGRSTGVAHLCES